MKKMLNRVIGRVCGSSAKLSSAITSATGGRGDGQLPFLVGTHHKCGTNLMHGITKDLQARLGLVLQSSCDTRVQDQGWDILIDHHSRFDGLDLKQLPVGLLVCSWSVIHGWWSYQGQSII